VGDRVYHRRADLFGKVMALSYAENRAAVKYEPPWNQASDPVRVPLSELRRA
jgi:hypothetical protein